MSRIPRRAFTLSTPSGSFCLSRPGDGVAALEPVNDAWTLRCVAFFAACEVEMRPAERDKLSDVAGETVPRLGAEAWIERAIVEGRLHVSKAVVAKYAGVARAPAPPPPRPEPRKEERPESEPPPKPKPKEATTCYNAAVIKCGHTDAGQGIGDGSPRGYKLKLPLPKDSKLSREYHVVSGHTKADDITIELKGGPCSHGKTPLEHVTVSGAEAKMGEGGITFKAFAPKLAIIGDPRDWVNIIWPFDMQPRQYDITPKLCEGTSLGSAVVKAYPYVKWELGLSLSLGERSATGTRGAEISKGGSIDGYVEWEKKSTGWGVGGEAKLTLDNGNYTKNLTADFQQYTKSAFKVMESFKDFASTLQGFMKSTGCGEFTLTLPKISIVYELETTEDKDDHLLDHIGKASLKLDPLIKVAYKYDVLNWVIGICVNGAAPGLGSAILKIKNRAEEGFGMAGAKISVKLSVDMTFTGGISGEVSWERRAKVRKWSTPKGKVSASVTGEIRAIAKGTADLWLVSLMAGAEAGAKIGFGYDVTASADSVGLFLQGQLRFDGIVLDYVVYHGSGRISKPPKGQTTDGGDGRTFTQTDEKGISRGGGSKTIDKEGKAELMKPRYWPEASKAGKHYVIRNRPLARF